VIILIQSRVNFIQFFQVTINNFSGGWSVDAQQLDKSILTTHAHPGVAFQIRVE